MRTKTVFKSAAVFGVIAAFLTAPLVALADDGSGSSGSGSSHSEEATLHAPHVFDARFQVNGVWQTGTTPVGGTAPITYHGGIAPTTGGAKVGVNRGAPKVYLVFWGSQWGTDTLISVDTRTVHSFSGDVTGMSRYLQDFIAGIGTTGDNWSGVLTEYCDQLATGASLCGSQDTANRVGYPAGSVLAGVWYDNTTNTSNATSATVASQAALAGEAVKAANYFGNVTQASNMNTQYVIVSPSGTHPNGFNYSTTGWCAWHDYTTSSTTGNLAYTNLPYMPDMGSSCGANFVNAGAAGKFDGVSIVEGHEYAETITDLWPSGGYYDSSGAENGDKCSWMTPTDSRNAGNITTATGTFAMQGTWSNLDAWCSMGRSLASTNASLTGTQGGAVAGRIASGGILPYTYVANTALPTGLTLGNDGRIVTSGVVPAGTYSYSYQVNDANGASVTATGTVTIAPAIATTTTLTVSSAAVSPTTSVTMTATVSPVLSGATVSFYDGATLLGTAKTATTGKATLAKTFAAGAHNLTATLTAPTGYSPSTSSVVTVTSTQATTITVKASTTSTRINTAVTLTGTLNVKVSGLTIAFVDSNNVTLGTGTTNTSGVATLSTKWTAATPTGYTVKAVFRGATYYTASTSTALAITVK